MLFIINYFWINWIKQILLYKKLYTQNQVNASLNVSINWTIMLFIGSFRFLGDLAKKLIKQLLIMKFGKFSNLAKK